MLFKDVPSEITAAIFAIAFGLAVNFVYFAYHIGQWKEQLASMKALVDAHALYGERIATLEGKIKAGR